MLMLLLRHSDLSMTQNPERDLVQISENDYYYLLVTEFEIYFKMSSPSSHSLRILSLLHAQLNSKILRLILLKLSEKRIDVLFIYS